MNYLKKCMYNKIAAYFHEHNSATSEVVENTIDGIFNSISA